MSDAVKLGCNAGIQICSGVVPLSLGDCGGIEEGDSELQLSENESYKRMSMLRAVARKSKPS